MDLFSSLLSGAREKNQKNVINPSETVVGVVVFNNMGVVTFELRTLQSLFLFQKKSWLAAT